MKNKVGYMLRETRKKAVTDGIQFALGLAFIAMNNVIDAYMDEEKCADFFKDTEKNVNEIYQTVLESVPSGEIDEMAEKIVYHVNRFRKKWGMDDESV
jgi:hypothetical protein